MSFLPTAAQHNEIHDLLMRAQMNRAIPAVTSVGAFKHPWQVKVSRATSIPSIPAGALQPWRVDVAPGWVMDAPATIPYLRTGDPRGWTVPPGYQPAASPGSPWIDRDPLDIPDDPPFLIAADPPSSDWTQVTEEQRNHLEDGAFTSASDWQQFPELWRASVILSATPLKLQFLGVEFPPPTFQRFRLYLNRAAPPPINFSADAGGLIEIASLYLLRDPDHPELAEVRTRQRVWYPLGNTVVQPDQNIIQQLQIAAGNNLDIFTSLLASNALGQAALLLNTTAQSYFWTV